MYTDDDFDWDGPKWVLKDGVPDASPIIGGSYLRPGAPKYQDLPTEPVYKKDADGNLVMDANGKPVIDHYEADGKITVKDRTIIGNASPDFTGGFSLSAYWKGFDLGANFNFMIGNQVYNANKIEFTSSRKYYNRNLLNMMDADKRWNNIDWATGDIVNDPETLRNMNSGITMWNPAVGNAIFSDWAVEDASFLRLQTLTLGYTLPENLTEKIKVRRLRVYATGTNLFCLTKYSGYDPEVDTRRATPLTPGVDYSAYPKSIGFVAGINLSF